MSSQPTTPLVPDPLSMAAVLRIPTMRRLWYAQLVSTFGDFLALFAVIGVLTFRLHATPQQVTGVQIAYTLPIALLGIIAGVFVDRWPLKATLVSSDLIRCVLCLLLLVAHDLFSFYLILASISIVSSFFGPAQGVTIRSAVPLHGLRSANALMQQVMFGMRIIGPAIAAFLVASFGPNTCYLADSASFLASGCLIATLSISRPAASVVLNAEADSPAAPKRGLASILSDMRAGIGFIVHHAGVLFVILALASGMFVIGCFGPLIAVYVRDSLHASTRVFGVASAMIGIGMFIGVNALNTIGKKLANTTLVYAGLGGIALGLCMLTLLTHIWSTMLGDLTIGFAVAGIVVPSNTMIQQETPHELMGRVGSTVMSLIFTAQICGLILSGLLANRIGVRHVFGLCAIFLALLIAAGRLWMEPKHVAQTA
jgi:MFS transporter, DHA3 family, macrolide efflux protein